MEMKVIVCLFFFTYGTYGETAANWCATSCKKPGKVVGGTQIFTERVSKISQGDVFIPTLEKHKILKCSYRPSE